MLSELAGVGSDFHFPKVEAKSDNPAFSAAVAIVIAYLQKAHCSEEHIIPLLRDVHQVALEILKIENSPNAPIPQEKARATKPAVPVKDSVTDEYLVCLEDGQKVKSLKRYLRSHYDMTIAQYRMKWSLPIDYPVVAPALSRKRSRIAKQVKPHQARVRSKAPQ
ncbi:MucR family transcriptional regulator [Microvirga sp. W0021]|uniref:MucR family transcriptional regulator n=1 Tax=Hohaiivirga grylli TaxID=3133970 RepID=A0ABV0BEL7_9HYPH